MRSVVICLLAVVLFSCGESYFFNEDKAIENQEWDKNKKLDFAVEFDDINSSYDFFIDFRHNDDYAYSDIYFFMDIVMPDGKSVHDTVSYILQNPDGTWLGKNSGSLVENHVLIKTNIKMPVKGKYTFILTHGMRDNVLSGIEDVGLVIAKRNK